MNDIPTPRTDAAHKRAEAFSSWAQAQEHIEQLARTLERQLHVAREALERVRSGMNGVLDCEDIARKALAQIDEIGGKNEQR